MFLYEAVEYLFDEMHSNNNYQFRNYLNLNIDNHFHSLMYSSNHYYNQAQIQQAQQLDSQAPTASTNHMSLTLLPSLKSQQHQQLKQHPSAKSAHSTLTLPNNIGFGSPITSFNLPVIVQPQPTGQPVRINEAIGSRLHNSFQDSTTTVPLTSAKISMDPQQNQQQTKSSFIDLPRSILPSFFETKPTQARRSTSANYRTSRALKFMNTMRIKSVSFKRALFPGNSNVSTSVQNEKSPTIPVPISASQTIQMQPAPQQQPSQTVQIDSNGRGTVLDSAGTVDSDEQKPSMIISLSSGSSSATTSSSSTALSSTPITTATETMSFKATGALTVANGVVTATGNSQLSKKLSRDQLN